MGDIKKLLAACEPIITTKEKLPANAKQLVVSELKFHQRVTVMIHLIAFLQRISAKLDMEIRGKNNLSGYLIIHLEDTYATSDSNKISVTQVQHQAENHFDLKAYRPTIMFPLAPYFNNKEQAIAYCIMSLLTALFTSKPEQKEFLLSILANSQMGTSATKKLGKAGYLSNPFDIKEKKKERRGLVIGVLLSLIDSSREDAYGDFDKAVKQLNTLLKPALDRRLTTCTISEARSQDSELEKAISKLDQAIHDPGPVEPESVAARIAYASKIKTVIESAKEDKAAEKPHLTRVANATAVLVKDPKDKKSVLQLNQSIQKSSGRKSKLHRRLRYLGTGLLFVAIFGAGLALAVHTGGISLAVSVTCWKALTLGKTATIADEVLTGIGGALAVGVTGYGGYTSIDHGTARILGKFSAVCSKPVTKAPDITSKIKGIFKR